MCDASDYAVGAVLGKRVDKKLNVIHYASKTLDNAQRNYATTEKELLAVVFACDKFRPYIVDSIEHMSCPKDINGKRSFFVMLVSIGGLLNTSLKFLGL